jgi:hypothetical protein
MPKSRDIQAKMPSPKVILNAFLLVTVKVLNSYEEFTLSKEIKTGRISKSIRKVSKRIESYRNKEKNITGRCGSGT